MRFIAIIPVCLGLISSCLAAPSQLSNFPQESVRQLNFDFNKPALLARDGIPDALHKFDAQSVIREVPQQQFNQQLDNNFEERFRSNGPIPVSQNPSISTGRSFDFPTGPAPGSRTAPQLAGQSFNFPISFAVGSQITLRTAGSSFDSPNGPAPATQITPQTDGRSFDFPNGPAPGSQITPQTAEKSFDFPKGSVPRPQIAPQATPGSQITPQAIERSFNFPTALASVSQIASLPTARLFDFQQLGIRPIKDFTGEINILPLPKDSADIASSLKGDPQLTATLKGDAHFIKSPNGNSNASPLPKSDANILPLPNEGCRFCENISPLPKGNADFSALFRSDANILPILNENAVLLPLPKSEANSLPSPNKNINFPTFQKENTDFSSLPKDGGNSLPLPKSNVNFPQFPIGNADFPSLPLPKDSANLLPFQKGNDSFLPLPKSDGNSQPMPKGNINFSSFSKGSADILSLPKSDTGLPSLPEGDANFLSFLKGNPDFMASFLRMVVNPLLLPKGGPNLLSIPKGNDDFLASLKNAANLPGPLNSDNLRTAPSASSQGFPRPAPDQRNAAPLPEQVKDTPEVAAAREAHLKTVAETASKLAEPVKETPEVMAAREAHLRIATTPEAAMSTEPPKYTPEVQAAREAHFRAYALAAKLAMESDLNPKILEQLLGRPGEPKLGPQKVEEIFAALIKSPIFTEERKRLMAMLNLPMSIQVPSMDMDPPKESLPQPTDSRGIINLMEKPQLKNPIKPAEIIVSPGAPQPSANLRIPDAKLTSIDEFEQSKLNAASDLKCNTELKVKDLKNVKPTEERRFIIIRTGELAPVMTTVPLPVDQAPRWKNFGIQYISL